MKDKVSVTILCSKTYINIVCVTAVIMKHKKLRSSVLTAAYKSMILFFMSTFISPIQAYIITMMMLFVSK